DSRKYENESGDFKNNGKRKFDSYEQIEVFAGIDQGIEAHVLFPLKQELDSKRKGQVVSEQSTQYEEHGREKDERQRIPAFMFIKSRRYKQPHLTQHERSCNEHGGEGCQFNV